MNPQSRAHRALKPLGRYIDLTGEGLAELPWTDKPPVAGEVVIGAYENVPGGSTDGWVVTDHALWLSTPSGWRQVEYANLLDVESPTQLHKHTADRLVLLTEVGERILLPVRGGKGQLRDAWEVLRFLRNVLEDTNRSPPG